jgi:HAD superfamily hydrolase (TIGR01509 family)
VRDRAFDPAGLKAVIFDVDGTLYRQGPLRLAMLWRLLRAHAVSPLRGLRTFRVLSAYRSAQEQLRAGTEDGDLASAQLRFASDRTRVAAPEVAACVAQWMEREPLPLLQRCVRPGALELLQACRARGLRLGVLSDYPADAKLEAMGLSGLFDVVACAQAAEIGVFKPNPRGLHVARERLGAAPGETLYVGDRPEVDAAAAQAAGMPCAILTRRPDANASTGWMQIAGFDDLRHKLLPEGPR